MKTPIALFFKAHVGPYLRGGKMVNLNGYQGRAAHAVASPGQLSLFDGSNTALDASNKSKIEPSKSEASMKKPEVKIKGRDVMVDGAIVATIHGSRDPSGKNHQGYWIRTKDGRDIGWNEKSRKGMFAYAEDAKRDAMANPGDLLPPAPAARPHATETPEFKDWSGGLPVIKHGDQNFGARGVYVAYHATPHEFSEFKTGGDDANISGHAIWASPYPDHQAAAHNIRTRTGFKDGVRVMPIYVRLSKPLLIDDLATLNWARQTFAGGSMEFPQFMPKQWADEVLLNGEYDGIVFDGEKIFGQGKDTEIIAFDSRQIKSAIGNNGKFDRSNSDITKALPVVFLGKS